MEQPRAARDAGGEGTAMGEPVWYPVCALGDLPVDGGGASFQVGGTQLAVFHHEEELHAIEDSCPHMGASLGMGVALEGDVTCPWHGWHFRLRDGRNTDGLETCVRTFEVRLDESGRVEVAVPPAAGGDQGPGGGL